MAPPNDLPIDKFGHWPGGLANAEHPHQTIASWLADLPGNQYLSGIKYLADEMSISSSRVFTLYEGMVDRKLRHIFEMKQLQWGDLPLVIAYENSRNDSDAELPVQSEELMAQDHINEMQLMERPQCLELWHPSREYASLHFGQPCEQSPVTLDPGPESPSPLWEWLYPGHPDYPVQAMHMSPSPPVSTISDNDLGVAPVTRHATPALDDDIEIRPDVVEVPSEINVTPPSDADSLLEEEQSTTGQSRPHADDGNEGGMEPSTDNGTGRLKRRIARIERRLARQDKRERRHLKRKLARRSDVRSATLE